MDTRGLVIPWVVMIVMGSAGGAAAKPRLKPSEALLGSWQCWGVSGTSQLIFESKARLVYNGDPAVYKLAPGIIRAYSDGRIEDYRYTLKGNSLSVTFPNGYCIQCRRMADGSGKNGSQEYAPSEARNGKGSEWQLKGMLCSWGGASSSSSSYGRSTRVSFDGLGQFHYSSESAFSSGAGGAYGRNAGSGSTGKYRVVGNKIYLTFIDGATGLAHVHMRQSSGRITEIEYNGQLFAAGLCN